MWMGLSEMGERPVAFALANVERLPVAWIGVEVDIGFEAIMQL
jgi:hypothetical protein